MYINALQGHGRRSDPEVPECSSKIDDAFSFDKRVERGGRYVGLQVRVIVMHKQRYMVWLSFMFFYLNSQGMQIFRIVEHSLYSIILAGLDEIDQSMSPNRWHGEVRRTYTPQKCDDQKCSN